MNTLIDSRWMWIGLLAGLVMVGLGGPAAADPGRQTFELIVDVHDADGRVPLDLGADDFEVRELGHSARVIDARPLAGREGLSARWAEDFDRPLAEPWRVVIYLDPAWTERRSQLRVIETLAGRAEELAALGRVEVVWAATAPRHVLASSQDAAAIRAAIRSLARPAGRHATLGGVRRDFLDRQGGAEAATDSIPVRDRVRQSARREVELLGQRLQILRHWVSTQAASGPTAFLWISDGFDVDLSEFYVRATGGLLRSEIEADLDPYEPHGELEDLIHQLALASWTTVPLAALDEPFLLAADVRPWVDGFQPLRLAAVHTGGVVISRTQEIPELLSNLGRRWVVTYQVPADPVGGVRRETPRRVVVSTHRGGLVARASLWRGLPVEPAPATAGEPGVVPVVAPAR